MSDTERQRLVQLAALIAAHGLASYGGGEWEGLEVDTTGGPIVSLDDLREIAAIAAQLPDAER